VPEAVFGPQQFAAATSVSRETLRHLEAFARTLMDWNGRHNLVSARSLDDLWRRHFWDSAQLAVHIPQNAETLVDLGSGAGFPGLVLAEMLRDRLIVTLVEATAKKCAFLAAAAKSMELPVRIENRRIEEGRPEAFDVITARAVAPLPMLLGYAQRFSGPNSVCLFLKGQNVGAELTQAHKSWKMRTRQIQSLTDPSGVILELKELHGPTQQKTPHPGGRQSKRRGG
jgi:16S rRNA (guanine527-N7)-methyltransferase